MAAFRVVYKNVVKTRLQLRYHSSETSTSSKKGLVLGAHTEENKSIVLTPAAKQFNEATKGHLVKQLHVLSAEFKSGSTRVLYGLDADHLAVCVVGLGKPKQGYDELEEIDMDKEEARLAAAGGARALQGLGITDVAVEDFGDAEAAAEGATLQTWLYQELKNTAKQKKMPRVTLHGTRTEDWSRGVVKADAQNLARRLTDTPANLMTPTIFANQAVDILGRLEKVVVSPRDQTWAESHKMGSFLSVTRGSSEPPVFLELDYQGSSKTQAPVVFVGKGVTFDTGGISIKPAASMDHMRGDMGGAACVFATIYAAAKLGLPLNIKGLIPLCENMPGSRATKPGDVVTAMNGKTIQVDNTDAEGRLILADALCYAQQFEPRLILDIATLTGAMRVAMGGAATGVFTNSSSLWSQLHKAGSYSGDRVWRFPLWKTYSKRMTDFPSVDVNNVGKGKGGGACTAAAFLKEFVPKGDWLHLDIAGVMGPGDDIPYLAKGMTGRPTRTLIQFLSQLS